MDTAMLKSANTEIEIVIKREAALYPWVAVPSGHAEVLKDLKKAFSKGITVDNPYMVFNGGSENTIYDLPETNFAFRVWHDSVHYNRDLNFSVADEVLVGYYQARMFDNPLASCLIYADTAGQRIYYERHREFVVNQKEFVYMLAEKLLSIFKRFNTDHNGLWSSMQSQCWKFVYSTNKI